MKKIFLSVAMLLSAVGMQASSSSSGIPGAWAQIVPQDQTNWVPGTLFHGLMRQLARDEFFEKLNDLRTNNPRMTIPREIIQAAVGQMSETDPIYFGLSIQDLIDHNLVPSITKGWIGKEIFNPSRMYIDDLTGIQNIPGIETVRYLDLKNNKLQTIVPGAFAGLINLQDLELSYNQLQEIVPGAFAGPPRLLELFLGHNKLQSIAPEAFANLTELLSLSLENNQLQTIAPGAFAGLKKLWTLNLEKNHITNPVEQNRIRTELHAIKPNIEIRIGYQTPAE